MIETVYANGSWGYIHPYAGIINAVVFILIVASTLSIEMFAVHYFLKGHSWRAVGTVVMGMNICTGVLGFLLLMLTVVLRSVW